MKKIISIVLTFVLVVTLGAGTAFADSWKNNGGKTMPPGLAKQGKIPNGIAKKLFDDANIFEWAEKAIEKLGSKGLVKGWEGKFYPQQSVTKLESVVMALRIMGWEEEASSIYKLPKEYKGDKVQDWAVGYVTLAYEKGILDEVDMMYWNPTEPVERFEVGKYVIRALGYEDEAQDHMDAKLNYKDASLIPQGAVGYVYLLKELGLMQGDGVSFNPFGTLTRAEMAVLFNSLDEKVDNGVEEDEFEGVVYKVYDDKIVIKTGNKTLTIDVDKAVVVYDGNRKVDYDDIEKGSKVIIFTEDEVAVYIEIVEENDDDDDDKIIDTYVGQIIKIDNDDMSITVQVQNQSIEFDVLDNVEVYFLKEEGEFEEVKVNDIAKITVDKRNRVRSIYIYREKEEVEEDKVEGYITDLDLVGIFHISINKVRYGLSEDAAVKIGSVTSKLENLELGMKVSVVIKDNVVESIQAEKVLTNIEGIIETADSDSIKITSNGQTKEFEFADAIIIDIKDYTDNVSNLKRGMKVELKLSNGKATYIYAEDNKYTIEAEIKTIINTSGGTMLNLLSGSNPYVLSVSSSVKIAIDGIVNPDIDDLKVGQTGEFDIINANIIEISIDD